MHVDFGLLLRASVLRSALVENIDDVVVGLVELRLREEGQQAVVAAVAVDDQNFLAAVARHFVGGFLQESELHVAAVGHGAGLVLGLGDLAEIIFGNTTAYSSSAACSAA